MRQLFLKKIAEITPGQGAPQKEDHFGETGNPFIRAGNLEQLLSNNNEDALKKVNINIAKKYKLRLFPINTGIFAKSGMSSLKNRIYITQNKCYLVNHLAAIIVKGKIDSKYFGLIFTFIVVLFLVFGKLNGLIIY